jgi:predicted carbohydrate-binding protein with CBM5 and CBM33 domain
MTNRGTGRGVHYRERVPWPPSARRTLAVAIVATAWLLAAAPAHAHGAMASPVSRASACGPEGGTAATSAACRAAAAASGGAGAFDAWDEIRVPGVNGRDRQVIPDGKLCSGGLAQFKGLDLARADWPATTLVAAASFTFRYRVTIPHRGSFRLYVTRDGYLPTRPLRWADLAAKPFLTVADPPVRNGSYVLTGRLPAARAGRQLIYTIWQTTSTPDTYYSCSDVVFRPVKAAAAPATAGTARKAAASPSPAWSRPPGSPAAATSPGNADTRPVADVSRTGPVMPALVAVGVGLVGAAVFLAVRRRRMEPARQTAARARERRPTRPPV